MSAGEWMPIETAPKDGTPLLLAVVNGDPLGGIPMICAGRWTVEGPYIFGWWGVAANSVCISRPTHWQPLPAPPALSPNREG
jgi:hypothetical protein